MRSSSIKKGFVVIGIVLALGAAAPPAHAAPVQPRESAVMRAVRRFFNRLVGGITANGLPTIPIPPPDEDTTAAQSGQ